MAVRRRHFCPLRHMLAFTSLVGIMNILCLLLYINMKESLEIYSLPKGSVRKLHRQISSIGSQGEGVAEITRPKRNVLEVLNAILYKTVERYTYANSITAPQYEDALRNPSREVVGQDLFMNMDINGVHRIRCDKRPFLLILVPSHPKSFIHRESIRLSWGEEENAINQGSWSRPENSWRTIFLVGKSTNSSLNGLLLHEAQEYGDIVVEKFLDTYHNLSFKMVKGLEWVQSSCKPEYILKTDEDCYVNTYSLIEWLKAYHVINGTRPLYTGRVQSNMLVARNNRSRHFLSEKEHPASTFTRYVSGGGYLFSASLLPRILAATRKVARIPIEDASFGRYMDHIGIKPTNNERFLPFIFCEHRRLFDIPMCYFQRPLVVHGVHDIQHISMHYNVLLLNFIPTLCDANVRKRIAKKPARGRCF